MQRIQGPGRALLPCLLPRRQENQSLFYMIPVYILVLFVFLVLGAIGAFRLPPVLATVLWVTVPLALMPVWLETAREYEWSWFLWAKTWTLVLACAWASVCCAWPRCR